MYKDAKELLAAFEGAIRHEESLDSAYAEGLPVKHSEFHEAIEDSRLIREEILRLLGVV